MFFYFIPFSPRVSFLLIEDLARFHAEIKRKINLEIVKR